MLNDIRNNRRLRAFCSIEIELTFVTLGHGFKQVAQRATIAHLSPMCQG